MTKVMKYSDWLGLGHMMNSSIMNQLHQNHMDSKWGRDGSSGEYQGTITRRREYRYPDRQKQIAPLLKKIYLLYPDLYKKDKYSSKYAFWNRNNIWECLLDVTLFFLISHLTILISWHVYCGLALFNRNMVWDTMQTTCTILNVSSSHIQKVKVRLTLRVYFI